MHLWLLFSPHADNKMLALFGLIVSFQPSGESWRWSLFLFVSPGSPARPPLPPSPLRVAIPSLCFPLSLLCFGFTTHRNFRKHLRMVGSRRIKAQSESDVCVWLIRLFKPTVMLLTSPSSLFLFFSYIFFLCCDLHEWHRALLWSSYELSVFWISQKLLHLLYVRAWKLCCGGTFFCCV